MQGESLTVFVVAAPVCYGMQENEDSLEDWAESLSELSAMKTDLSQYIIADDVLLLQEQVEHLHCQWEELCLKVSLLATQTLQQDFITSHCLLVTQQCVHGQLAAKCLKCTNRHLRKGFTSAVSVDVFENLLRVLWVESF